MTDLARASLQEAPVCSRRVNLSCAWLIKAVRTDGVASRGPTAQIGATSVALLTPRTAGWEAENVERSWRRMC